MSNIWTEVQSIKAAVRQLREDHDTLQGELRRALEDHLLDSLEIERQRTEIQRLWAEMAAVKETLRQALDEGLTSSAP
jgi:hypothetical protein